MTTGKMIILYTGVEKGRHLSINPKENLTDVLTRLSAMMTCNAISP